MEHIFYTLTDPGNRCLAATATLVCGSVTIYALRKVVKRRSEAKRKAERRAKWDSYGKDVVVLHMFARSKYSPNPSPFPTKVELFLKANKIKYEVDFTQPMSSKGKCPWISFNGEDIADSQFAIEHLAKHFDIDMSAHLSKEEKATARAFRLLMEERLYWCFVVDRWDWNKGKDLYSHFDTRKMGPTWLLKITMYFMGSKVAESAKAQGTGRHSREEVIHVGVGDFQALSEYLDEKPYLMGDKMTEVDCTLFAFLSILLHCTDGAEWMKAEVNENGSCGNLVRYFERLRVEFWSDWDPKKANF